jgi:hypothetical protein
MRDLTKMQTASLIIRATWHGGDTNQRNLAIREIDARGCWLADRQMEQAGVTLAEYRAICGRNPETGMRL